MGVMTEERWLTVNDAAARLRVDGDTIRRWIKLGRMHGAQLGGRKAPYRIPEREVERLERMVRGEPE